jgi:hypothetical protein
MPDVTLTVATEDTTACYDIRGRYFLDLRVKVATEGAVFEGLTHVNGNFVEGDDVLAAFDDVCGDISSSTTWSGLFEGNAAGGEGICVSAEMRRTEEGIAVAAEVSTREATGAGHRVGWSYRE